MAGDTYWARLQRRRVSRRRFLAGSGVAAAGSAALLAGCGGDSPAPPPVATQPPTATRPPATPTPMPAATATPSPTPSPTPTAIPTPDPNAPRRGGTLRLWKSEPDMGLDPGIYHLNNRDIIYSTLTQALTYQPTKNLFAMDGMTGYEQVDPVTLVWSIRPGMKFHNGDPVDAEAVAFSFGRLGKLYDALDGTHVTPAGFRFVHSFEATDDLTLTEHWSRPNADALVYRARHYYSFLNPRVVEAHGAFEGTYTAPDGTTEDMLSVQDLPFGAGSGPYTLVRRDETGTRVERWPDYHKHTPADDGFVEDGPYIDAWETRILPDSVTAKGAFVAGELDFYDRVSARELPEFEVEGLGHVSVAEIPNGGFSMLGMDGAKFHDRRARQALQKAFDYEGFIEAVRPLGGRYAAPISDLLPHFQRLSQEELKQWYRHDPKEARALWEAADFEEPLATIGVLLFHGSLLAAQIGEFAAQSLGETLGVETELFINHGSWAPQLRPPPGEPKEYELLSYGSGADGGTLGIPGDTHLVHYDPRTYGLYAFNFFAESPEPEIAEDSRALNAMLVAQEREMDFGARVERLTEIQRWILDRHWCNWALPVNQSQYYGFSAQLRDHAPDDWPNFYGLRRESMWLADA